MGEEYHVLFIILVNFYLLWGILRFTRGEITGVYFIVGKKSPGFYPYEVMLHEEGIVGDFSF